MSKKEAGNFTQNIHLEDYTAEFHTIKIGAESHIHDYGREAELLSGCWNFGIDQYDNCLRSRWFEEKYFDDGGRELPLDYSFDQWEIITVPSCWNLLQERYFLYEGSCVYTLNINFSPKDNERVFLRFGAASTTAYVFLNKEYIGTHTGGYTPFSIEVTGKLKAQNRLLVVVNNTRKPTGVPTDNTDWFNYGGLHRDVTLLRVPETFIRDFFISLMPDGTFSKIKAVVKIDGKGCDGTATLKIPELEIQQDISITSGSGELVFEATPELWSPDNPRLYDVSLTYSSNNNAADTTDTITDRVGFREIKVKNNGIFLNGNEIYLKGVCTHEESVPNGNSVTAQEVRENFMLAKELGCNFMRLAHYPHNEQAARIADEVGIMLWEELPVYWAIAFTNKDTYNNAENQLSELIYRDRNRASVIIWSVGNENIDSDERLAFMSKLTQKARELDNTRLISAACMVDGKALKIKDRLAEHLDVIGINEYYGWYEPDFSKLPKIFKNSRPAKPIIITEFGADAKAKFKGAPGTLISEENQRDVYEKQMETIKQIDYVKGTCPWILYDFRCPRRLHHLQDYYNLKGLLSADKTYKKPAFEVMKKFYSTVSSGGSFSSA